MASSVAWSISSVSGMPETLLSRTSGTMVSPWPPSTTAVTFSTETFNSAAIKVRKRAVSSTPAMPITRCFGNFEAWYAVQHIRHQHQNRVGRMVRHFLGDAFHHFVIGHQKIVAAHARLTGQPGGDDN